MLINKLATISATLIGILILGGDAAYSAPTKYGTPYEVAPFTLPGGVTEMATADLNGDGFDDVIATSQRFPVDIKKTQIQFLLSDGKGHFSIATRQLISGHIPGTIHPRKIVIAKFTKTSQPGIFVADHGHDAPPYAGAQSILLLPDGKGKYVDATANLPQQIAYTHSAAAADINGSGVASLYMGNLANPDGSNPIPAQLLLNDGTGHFKVTHGRLPAAQTALQTTYTASEFVDVDGDGCPDLILGGDANIDSVVLHNDCHGYFKEVKNAFPPKLLPHGLVVDIKAVKIGPSGKPDLLLSETRNNYSGRAIQVLINDGHGKFIDQSKERLNFKNGGLWIDRITTPDTRGKCVPDIFAQFFGTETLMFLNNGSGYFTRLKANLPTLYGNALPIDLYNDGSVSFLSLDGGDGYYAVTPAIDQHLCASRFTSIR